jgi:DNA-binding transcriptional regulator YiaG
MPAKPTETGLRGARAPLARPIKIRARRKQDLPLAKQAEKFVNWRMTNRHPKDFAALVRRWRKARGLSRPQAAKRLGIPYRTIQSWELGDRTPRGLALQLITARLSRVF